MGKIECVRILRFCAGHRVMGHENKCATAHGHNYTVHLYAEAPELDDIGRVIDFGVLKEKIGSWIDEKWDHTFLVCERDEELIKALTSVSRNKEPFICPFNPTAEEIADYLLREVSPKRLEGTGVTISKVIIYETENCYAESSL